MNITPISTNTTEPLSYYENIDNKIYDYEPPIESKYLKKLRSFSATKYPRQLSRTPSKKFHARRKRSPYALSTPPINLTIPSSPFTHLQFSVSCSPSESSDSDSLPDLSDDKDTPFSSPIHRYPLTPNNSYFPSTKSSNITSLLKQCAQPAIFDIPEIVYKIVEYADVQSTIVPQEGTPSRRRPLSADHALLIHGNKMEAELALQESPIHETQKNGCLFNCLQVNKLFNQVTNEILSRKFFFSDEDKFRNFVNNFTNSPIKFKPSLIVLHKLFQTKQNTIDFIKDHIDFSNLEWLEFYMCPKLLPTPEFLEYGTRIKKIVITGSKILDDEFLGMISKKCPNLEVLDLRACELISDSGIYQIAKNCKKLTNINLGRKNKGHLITDSSICLLIRNNPQLNTVGLAGCHISDKSLWDLAVHTSNHLQRLSVNNCPNITNQSIPLILHSNYFTNISVLELRFAYQITNFRPIIEFKRRQEFKGISILIEVCEHLCLLMRKQELEMDKVISQRIFKDILDWANDKDDGDLPYQNFLDSRRLIK